MAAQNIYTVDAYYFNYYLISAVSEYLNNVEQHSYQKLTDDWWQSIAEEFIPQFNADNKNLECIQNTIFDKVIDCFPEKFLTEDQAKELFEQIGSAIDAFIDRNRSICFCGDTECDFQCGTQSCGVCIDCCRCRDYY